MHNFNSKSWKKNFRMKTHCTGWHQLLIILYVTNKSMMNKYAISKVSIMQIKSCQWIETHQRGQQSAETFVKKLLSLQQVSILAIPLLVSYNFVVDSMNMCICASLLFNVVDIFPFIYNNCRNSFQSLRKCRLFSITKSVWLTL